MNTATESTIPTIPGTPFEGGFYIGTIASGPDVHALILAPKSEGRHDRAVWHSKYEVIDGAGSFFDGLSNTQAMAKAGSKIAKWALGLNIAGFNDWHLPSRDELEMIYRHFKPTDEENWVYRNGDNPSSLPVGYPYTDVLPTKTSTTPFQEGGAEAFEDAIYWSSTQYSSGSAWYQHFSDGGQGYAFKHDEFRVAAVRRLKI